MRYSREVTKSRLEGCMNLIDMSNLAATGVIRKAGSNGWTAGMCCLRFSSYDVVRRAIRDIIASTFGWAARGS